jgi:hypothetical protein
MYVEKCLPLALDLADTIALCLYVLLRANLGQILHRNHKQQTDEARLGDGRSQSRFT